MAQTRLLESHRDALRDLARRVVDCPAETKGEEVAYQRAAAVCRKIIEKQFPAADMAVFAKYEMTRPDACVRFQLTAGGVEQFCFRKGEEVTVPRAGGCSSRIYMADERATEAVQKWVAAKAAKESATQTKLRQYYSFIGAAPNFEQVLEIWPEASQLAAVISKNLPIALSEADIAAITADSTRRLAKAA
jgi:hypothetical protein